MSNGHSTTLRDIRDHLISIRVLAETSRCNLADHIRGMHILLNHAEAEDQDLREQLVTVRRQYRILHANYVCHSPIYS